MAMPQGSESLAEHRLVLARELLDDIELGRLPSETLLLKATRLARAMGASEVQEWLAFELRGYPLTDAPPSVAQHGIRVGRVSDVANLVGYWQPFPELLAFIRAQEIELQSLKVPSVHFAPSSANPDEYVAGIFGQHVKAATGPVDAVVNRMAVLSANIAALRGVISKIVSALHDFVSKTYYELAFKDLAAGIFESHRKLVDTMLAATAGDALQKIPAIAERLGAGDGEAVSSAMTTCRRVLAAFADALQPPGTEKLPYGDQWMDAGAEHYLNRLRYVIKKRCGSEHREVRLRQTLTNLNTRFNAGTHADVTPDEARALFVGLYVFLGEVLSLPAESTGPAEITPQGVKG